MVIAGCSTPADQASGLADQGSDPAAVSSLAAEPVQASPAPSTPALTFQLVCPTAYTGSATHLDAPFNYDIEGAQAYRVRIDYGDFQVAENDQDHLNEVLNHRYYIPGRHVVTATVTDDQGRTAQATCDFVWTLPDFPELTQPLPDPGSDGTAPDDTAPDDAAPGDTASGDTALCSDGTLTSAAGTQGACSWHGGLADSSASGGTTGVGGGTTWVNGYTRSDGTYVQGYVRGTP